MVSENFLQPLADGSSGDPFSVLGPHRNEAGTVVRTIQPDADGVVLLDVDGSVIAPMSRVHPVGIFEYQSARALTNYRLRIEQKGNASVIDDAYRFQSSLGELDSYLIGEGHHFDLFQKLGAHSQTHGNSVGTNFAVWAPNASRASVVGDFNAWDGRRHAMRNHPAIGVWDIFIPGVKPGDRYKFELLDSNGKLLPLKADPFAFQMETPPGNASVVNDDRYQWSDAVWLENMASTESHRQPMNIYEVHLASWRWHDNRPLGFRELANQLVPYVVDMGFTHVELLPIAAYPFEGSWGYQPIGLFAPDSRPGGPNDLRYLIDQCHANNVGVIIDWVPAHFPKDDHGLRNFDGTHLYEHADPKRGEHPDWGTCEFNLGRPEVANYLIASALYWIKAFHVDMLRVDAVASLLYLDYSRKPGEWIANRDGGNEDYDAVAFLKTFNTEVHATGAMTIAEESTAWPKVTRPIEDGGLGFSFKWNMGWMNDTLDYIREDSVHRRYHHGKISFGLMYAFSENFVLPLSHDEVVHGKGSLINKMPGDDWQKFANLRAYLTLMYGHPGKKLLFMGNEFAQNVEWNHNQSLDWALLDNDFHRGIQSLVRDLNGLIQSTRALFELDSEDAGFNWIASDDYEQSVYAFIRWDEARCAPVVVVVNFTPVVRESYRIGIPVAGEWMEVFNSDRTIYCGSGVGNSGIICSEESSSHGQNYSITITLPPLAGVMLIPVNVAS